jgi:hypothetical protein
MRREQEKICHLRGQRYKKNVSCWDEEATAVMFHTSQQSSGKVHTHIMLFIL